MVIHRDLISELAGVSGGSDGGSGTPLNPYQVWSANDLNQIREGSELYPNALESHYIQMANIDLSGYSSGEGWNPIGTLSVPFKGSYDGNNFKISNLNINRPTGDYQSLFGYCENIWYVKNITIENSNIEGKYCTSLLVSRIVLSMEYDINNNTLLDLSNNKILQCTVSETEGDSGGIIGRISNYGNLDYSNNLHISFNNSNINGLVCNFSGGYSGGILGRIDIPIANTFKTIYMNYENIELTNININLSGNQYGFGFMLGYITHTIGIFSIKNVILDYCIFDGLNSTGGYCGGIAGNINSGIKIENVIIKDTCEWNNLSNNINSAGILSYSTLKTSTESINDEFYIKNCYNYANINGQNYTGGIIGQITNSNNSINFKIINCINYGDVNGNSYSGGIVGNASLSSTHPEGGIYNCANYGNISGYSYVGGFAGVCGSKVHNCFSFGDVSGNSYVAGFVGNGNGSNIVNCYSIGVISATTTTYVRGFFGRYGTYTNCYCGSRCNQTNSGGTGATIVADIVMKFGSIPDSNVYINWDKNIWDDNNLYFPILKWMKDEGIDHPYDIELVEGDGTANKPYFVYNEEDLNSIRVGSTRYNNPLTSHYYQMADIDLSSFTEDGGWIPIGDTTNKFNGTYNGCGFEISNLYINRPTEQYQGLFGYCNLSTNVIKGLRINGVNITAKRYSGSLGYVGDLIDCRVKNIIINCEDDCSLLAFAKAGTAITYKCVVENFEINYSNLTGYSYITRGSGNYDEVKCENGIININGGNIYDFGAFYSGTTSTYYRNNYIKNVTINISNLVSGISFLAGFLSMSPNTGRCLNNYCSITINNNSGITPMYYGAMIGHQQYDEPDGNNYCNTDLNPGLPVVGTKTNEAFAGFYGKTEQEMKEGDIPDTDIYVNWSPEIWTAVDVNHMPRFVWEDPIETEYGDGTQSDPYKIYTADDLNSIRHNSSKFTNPLSSYYKIMNDIDLSSISNWEPIGSNTNSFTGVIYGDNKTISNLNINNDTLSNVGLFGFISGNALLRDIKVNNATIICKSIAGGLLGRIASTTASIYNCHTNNIDITGVYNDRYDGLGGLIGLIQSHYTIDRCSATNVDIKSTDSSIMYQSTGGFVGHITGNGIVKRCFSTGSVSIAGQQRDCGGFIGISESGSWTIENCYSWTNVTGYHFTAGFIGRIAPTTATIKNCYSIGSVTGGGVDFGGFIGRGYGTSYINNYFDYETAGTSNNYAGTATAKTTQQMQEGLIPDTTIYIEWDDTIWDSIDTSNYPRLKWELE